MARPTKYTPDRAERILAGLKAGLTRTAAAATGGITLDTLTNWMKRYSGFSASVTLAEGEAEARFTATITKAASTGSWKAAESWLKRRRSKDWGDRQQHTGADGGPQEFRVVIVGSTEQQRLAAWGDDGADTGSPAPEAGDGASD